MKTRPARLDADGTAKPLTRIVTQAVDGKTFSRRGMPLIEPELEDEDGLRTPLVGSETRDERTVRRLLDE